MEQKKMLRREILTKRNSLSESEQYRADILITERILGHQWFYCSDTILAYASYGSELRTDEIISETLRLGKKLYLPRVEGEELCFYRVESPEELVSGYKGIREPDGTTEKWQYDKESDCAKLLFLMPGVIFDSFGNRCGYGKGFYDRFLADKEALRLRSIGIGHKCQVIDRLDTEEWDRKPYQIICV